MELLDLLDTAAGRTIAYVTAAGLLVGALRWGWKLTRKFHRMADQFLGDPDLGIPSLPERVGAIEKEMRPNGGASLRDAVDTVNTKLDSHISEHAKAPVTVNVGTPPSGQSG